MYHLELRKFPQVVCRFNQSEAQMRAIVIPWVREDWVEEGERKWNVNESALTVLEGPKLSMPELAMGRGWRNAQRRSEDVTERVLAAARGAGGVGGGAAAGGLGAGADPQVPEPGAASAAAGGTDLLADSLGLELLALLDDGALPPARAWEVARIRIDRGSAADSLALAERAVRSLLGRGLAVLRRGDGTGEELSPEQAEAALAAAETWGGGEGAEAVVIARRR
ncbi:MAG TPA: hypothetical protein VL988_01520 [Solirubrobacteraceae bacterium]|nr:hypothetical protein [Solirubrobacteraceae bacterium]